MAFTCVVVAHVRVRVEGRNYGCWFDVVSGNVAAVYYHFDFEVRRDYGNRPDYVRFVGERHYYEKLRPWFRVVGNRSYATAFHLCRTCGPFLFLSGHGQFSLRQHLWPKPSLS